MKTYLLTLIVLSFLSGALLWLFSSSKYEKHLRYLCSLVLLICLAAPLKDIFSGNLSSLFPTFEQSSTVYASSYGARLRQVGAEALEKELTAAVASGADLDEQDFTLRAHIALDGTDLSLTSVEVTLHTVKAVAAREKIRSLLLRDLSEQIILNFTEDLS